MLYEQQSHKYRVQCTVLAHALEHDDELWGQRVLKRDSIQERFRDSCHPVRVFMLYFIF